MPIKNSDIGDNVVIHHTYLVNIYGATIGNDCKIGCFVEIGPAIIGNNCNIQSNVYIPEGVVIGDGVFIGPGVTFTNDKYPPSNGKWRDEYPIVVESGVTIGARAVILPGVHIHRKARIAAGAIITKDVPEGQISYGSQKSD